MFCGIFLTAVYMILRVYQKPQMFTPELSKTTISITKYALLLHLPFAFLMHSAPNLLASPTVPVIEEFLSAEEGENYTYIQASRLSQLHIVVLLACTILILFVVLLEDLVVGTCRACRKKCCRMKCCARRKKVAGGGLVEMERVDSMEKDGKEGAVGDRDIIMEQDQ